MNVALICERLHTLPNEGGVLQQENWHVRRLLVIFDQLDRYREEELKKASNTSEQQPTNQPMRMPGQPPSQVRQLNSR